MPTLRFHAFEAEDIRKVSKDLVCELAQLCEIPEDYFNLEIINSQFVNAGEFTKGFPIIEVHAFKRPGEIEDLFAQTTCRYMKLAGYPESELYFIHLQARHYYNNGEHY